MIAFPILNSGFSGHTIGLAGSKELLFRVTDTPAETDAATTAITAKAVIFAAPLQKHTKYTKRTRNEWDGIHFAAHESINHLRSGNSHPHSHSPRCG